MKFIIDITPDPDVTLPPDTELEDVIFDFLMTAEDTDVPGIQSFDSCLSLREMD